MYHQTEAAATEPGQFQGVSKSKIHEEVSKTYLLPDVDARCCTRSYLLQVFHGEVFRIRRQEILAFEVTLTSEQTQKSSFFNMNLLKERASAFLLQLGYAGFGFPNNTNPDESWFTRVLRYIDAYNVLGAFRLRVAGAPVPRCLAGRV